MSGRYLGPVQWRPSGEDRELCAQLQPAARNGLEWLFQQIGKGSGVRQGVWVVDMGPGIRGAFRALAIQDPNGFRRGFVDLEVRRDTEDKKLLSGVLRIEPGLLTYSGDIPLTPWTSTALADWLSGPGWEIPDSDGAVTWFVGRVEMTDAGPRWPDDPPLSGLGADGYTSQCYASEAALDAVLGAPPIAILASPPHEHTGPARLWTEACLAAGRPFSRRVPSGCSAAPGHVQIMWSSGAAGERRAWALDISDAGLIAWPMRVSDLTRPILTWIEDGDLTGITASLAWLYVYADLEPEPGGEPVEVLSAEDLATAYGDGGPLVMSGWVSPPHTGAPGLEMSSVLGGTLQTGTMAERFRTRLVTATISAVGPADPTATVSTGDAAEWRVDPRCLLYVGEPASAIALRNHPTYPGPVSGYDSAPVLCMYTGDGTLDVLWYWVSVTAPASDEDEADTAGCGTGGYRSHSTGLGRESVGYGWSRPPARVIGTGSITQAVGSWEGLTWADWPPYTSRYGYWDYSVWQCSTDCGDAHWYPAGVDWGSPPQGDWYHQGYQVRTQTGRAVGTKVTEYLTGADIRQVGAYWQGMPDAVWLAWVSVGSDHVERIEVRKKAWWKAKEWRGVAYWYQSSPQAGGWVDYPVHTGAGLTSWATFFSSYPDESSVTQPSLPLVWDDTTTLRIAGQDYAAGGWADWDAWWPAPAEAASIGVAALVSAAGSAIYVPYPEAEWGRIGIGEAAPANLALGWAGA